MKYFSVLLTAFISLTVAFGALQEELKYYLDRHNVHDEGYEMVAAYAQRGDTMLTRLPTEPLQLLNIGHWRGVVRSGTGMERDSLGRIIVGRYAADTLYHGWRTDSAAVYSGDFAQGVANGHGSNT